MAECDYYEYLNEDQEENESSIEHLCCICLERESIISGLCGMCSELNSLLI
jgi:hypothetical protein